MTNFSKTQTLIEQMVSQHVVPGVSFAFISGPDTQLHYQGQSQWAPTEKPLKPDQYYDMASLTKVMTTTLMILKLIEAKQLSLQTPIQQFLPEFQDERVTVQHLLTHTSGIAGYIPHRNELPAPQLKAALLQLPVGPGFERVVKYTDIGLIFLGFIIEAIYHQPVQQVLTDEILKPLGLTQSTFAPDKAQTIPTVYDPKTGLLQGVVHDPKARILGIHCASAGLFSTLPDTVKFARYMLGQYVPAAAPVTQAVLADLYQSYSNLPDQPRSLGWDLRQGLGDQHWLLYHTGYTGTFMALDRQNQNAMIVLTNRIHPTGHNETFLQRRDEIVAAFAKESIQA
ncbi:MAG: beta-lactamase family protein [Lactobacillus sp.]|nr:beta-lactamase family protein [Lactobacillus sp.]